LNLAYDLPALEQQLKKAPGMVVTISGGVDSAVLLAAAVNTLGTDSVLAAIAVSPSLAQAELEDARAIAESQGVDLVELLTCETKDHRYKANRGDRCFWCKEQLFTHATVYAERHGWKVAYGENASDDPGERPGARSASNWGVLSPLRDAGWDKEAVRAYARDIGLGVAEKPAAPCLASRVATGVPVNVADLERIEAVELELKNRGYRILRARHLGAEQMVLEFSSEELERAQQEQEQLLELAATHGYTDCTVRRYVCGGVAAATSQT
jgi:pyridinium-3,5-biscarboxylic acid mononucleotide sulfurtransferase